MLSYQIYLVVLMGQYFIYITDSGGVNVVPQNENNLIINISGVQQNPGDAFVGVNYYLYRTTRFIRYIFGIMLGDVQTVGTLRTRLYLLLVCLLLFVKNNQTLTGYRQVLRKCFTCRTSNSKRNSHYNIWYNIGNRIT